MKSKSLILLLVSLFVLFSCDDGIKFDNPLDERNRTSDSNDTEAGTESDNDKTDTESEYDDDKTDTASTNDEENQNRDDSDSGDTMQDDADSIDDSGDSMTDENTPDNDSADSVPDDDSDSTDTTPDESDSTPDEDADTDTIPADQCNPNPCSNVANSTGACTVSGTSYSCGCNQNYTWNDSMLTCDANLKPGDCTSIPENAVYNTVDEITQTWNGEEWIPTNESYFSETSSTTECRFKCKSNYIWTGSQCALPTTPCDSNPCSGLANSNGSCTIAGSNYVCGCNTHYTWTGSLCKADEQTKPCTGKPENASWNTASQIKQTWDGEEWYPSTTAVYNTNASTTECRYKCSTNYSWNSSNSTCVLTTQQGTCSAKPENTVWNDNGKNGKFDQIWNGSTYTPESYISTYNETAGTCRFKCASAEYTWNGSTCQLGSSGGSKSLGEICTGQDNCYDNSSEIACPTSSSADFYGQDAQYTSKCTAQSFSSSTNVVVDNNTGLTWEKSPSEGTYTWANRATHCTELNSSNYGGKSNWRVPNPLELLTIVDNSTYNPATNSNFTNMPSDSSVWFWTSAEYKGNTSYAYAFKPYFGNYFGYASDSYSKTKTYKVLCVSGDEMQPATSANFTTQTIMQQTKDGRKHSSTAKIQVMQDIPIGDCRIKMNLHH